MWHAKHYIVIYIYIYITLYIYIYMLFLDLKAQTNGPVRKKTKILSQGPKTLSYQFIIIIQNARL